VRAVIGELVSLVVDDTLTFVGAAGALVLTWLLAHHLRVGRAVDGFLLFGITWTVLLVSMRREAKARRR
jgi:hypothetical protein